ncbi:MAG: aminotransferase class I/II-fold pyridoxal phosphate-dependent enzyme, partial [Gammaproteobacteria bacterium]|nr:aminotransferase class I/II-fold pyridoxal phosphate-dependent enzyme [Gammaproteobacteria bacterium]
MRDIRQIIKDRIKTQQSLGLYRQRKIIESAQSVHIKIKQQEFLNFSSNDYLGLANHPKLKKAFHNGVEQYGCGSGASHLMSGHTRAHHQFEEEVADFLGVEAVLLYSSGYMANLGIMNALLSKDDGIFQDKLNHASLIDAGVSASAKMKRFSHLDYNHLQQLLEKTNAQYKFLVTDAVFSMDGDVADLK